MRKIFRSVLFWHIAIGVIIVAICWACGFRITYSPNIDYNWDAIGAVANWVGAAIVPFAVAFLEHRWDKNKEEIARSNSAAVEEINRIQEQINSIVQELCNRNGELLILDGGNAFESAEPSRQEQIRQYINIAINPTTQEIANYLKIPIEELKSILKEMKEQRIIGTKYIRDDISKPDCKWKLLNE